MIIVIFTLVMGGCSLFESNQGAEFETGPLVTGVFSPDGLADADQTVSPVSGTDVPIDDVESPLASAVTLTQESSRSPAYPGEAWQYNFPQTVLGDFTLSGDGTAYVLLEDYTLYILNSDGSLLGNFILPRKPFTFPETNTRLETPIYPVGLPDGTILMVAEDFNVIAMSPMGDILWEVPLDSEPYGLPSVRGGVFYLQDKEAGLHIFDANGLVWDLKSDMAPITATEISIGVDGSIYYLVTNYSESFLQAFGSDSRDLWVSRLDREDFYKQAFVSPDGQFVSQGNDLMFADNGEKLNPQLSIGVDEYVFGRDGYLYALMDQDVIQFEVVGNQVEVIKEISWLDGAKLDSQPTSLHVDANGVIWIEFGESLNKQLVWINQQGELIRTFNMENTLGFYGDPDYIGSRLLFCITVMDFNTTDCGLYSALQREALWEETAVDLPLFTSSHAQGEYIYLLTWDGNLRKISLAGPSNS
ncbi:MAG: hypothetical protein ACWGN2_04975 [Anaerolineales bacterium]